MKRQNLYLFLLSSCCLASCSLEKPLTYAEDCPGAVYYSKSDGTKVGEFTNPDSEYYNYYSNSHHCPEAYPVCTQNAKGTFCREMCRDEEVFCFDRCVLPLENSTYCGARGFCSNNDPNSDDFMGVTCANEEICRKGACVCARNTDILCNGKCIDPDYDMTYCGAKGLCSDADINSLNYKGQQCDNSQRCNYGKCTCGHISDILCDGKCIDPAYDANHCGAASSGLCNDPAPNSVNYMGAQCTGGMHCEEGSCVCAKKWEMVCGEDGCIDPSQNNLHCGAASGGLCNDPDPRSANYMGAKCDGGRSCEAGVCQCANQTDVFCDGSCIDPDTNHEHCGANGLCLHDDPENPDFAGGNCNGFACVDGICQCGEGYRLYHNSCEIESQENCGDHGNVCKPGPYDTSVECRNGECVATECKAGVSFFAAARNFGIGNNVIINAMHEDEICTTCEGLIRNATVGDTIYFGHYMQLSENSSEKQPLAWLVLDVDAEKGVLLISKYVLEPRRYHAISKDMTWERSTMRSWLNGLGADSNDEGEDYSGADAGFIQVAFNAEEQKCIQTTIINNQDNVEYEIDGGNPTEDKVFLLSMCELGYKGGKLTCEDKAYFASKSDRKAYATDYARFGFPGVNVYIEAEDSIDVRYGEYAGKYYSVMWWLRSPGSSAKDAVVLYTDGAMFDYGSNVYTPNVGVRPALWIK